MEPIHKEMILASLEKFNTCEVKVGGTSMWPFIQDGDIISLRHKPFKPRLGAVVGFFDEDQFIAHRIVWYTKKGTKGWNVYVHGDSSPCSLTRIGSNQVIGTVEYIKRGTKKITSWFIFPFRIITIPYGIVLQLLVAIKNFLN